MLEDRKKKNKRRDILFLFLLYQGFMIVSHKVDKWVVPEQSQTLSLIYPPNKTIEKTPNICLSYLDKKNKDIKERTIFPAVEFAGYAVKCVVQLSFA